MMPRQYKTLFQINDENVSCVDEMLTKIRLVTWGPQCACPTHPPLNSTLQFRPNCQSLQWPIQLFMLRTPSPPCTQ